MLITVSLLDLLEILIVTRSLNKFPHIATSCLDNYITSRIANGYILLGYKFVQVGFVAGEGVGEFASFHFDLTVLER